MTNRPLFVIPDDLYEPPRRYMVKDKKGNILFITELRDKNPEETAVLWAMREGGWLAGIIEGGKIPSNLINTNIVIEIRVDKPLYIFLDAFEKRYLVVDDENNVLFLTSINDAEPQQSATLAAMRLGGWLKGAVNSIQKTQK